MQAVHHEWKGAQMEQMENSFNNKFNELKMLTAIIMDTLIYGAHNINKYKYHDDVTAALDNLSSAAISKVDTI